MEHKLIWQTRYLPNRILYLPIYFLVFINISPFPPQVFQKKIDYFDEKMGLGKQVLLEIGYSFGEIN